MEHGASPGVAPSGLEGRAAPLCSRTTEGDRPASAQQSTRWAEAAVHTGTPVRRFRAVANRRDYAADTDGRPGRPAATPAFPRNFTKRGGAPTTDPGRPVPSRGQPVHLPR